MSTDTAVDQVEDWEYESPAHLQYWPAHVHPTGPGSWDKPRLFSTLREAIEAAASDPAPPSGVAWILTSGGRTLQAAEIEALWLDQKAAEASGGAKAARP